MTAIDIKKEMKRIDDKLIYIDDLFPKIDLVPGV